MRVALEDPHHDHRRRRIHLELIALHHRMSVCVLPVRVIITTSRYARRCSLFYSLIESVKPCGGETRAYLGAAARRAIGYPGTVTLQRDCV